MYILQLATDRLHRNNAPEDAVNEFKGGMSRIINECAKSGPKILTQQN